MPTATLEETNQTFEICKETEIAAPIEVAFEALLEEIGPAGQMPDSRPFPMKIEPWPGGRWYRDLGNNTGHFWGHVQVIKPPTLLEICGPLWMSTAAMSHIQYRLTAEGRGTRLKLTHRAAGQVPRPSWDGANQGWEFRLKRIGELAEHLAREKKSR
jgi:uncharacterized protein YndB with AHSA1/START domain